MDTGKDKKRSSDIDAHLKRAFRELEKENLPDRLVGLLDQLRSQDEAGNTPEADDDGEEASGRREAEHLGVAGGRA